MAVDVVVVNYHTDDLLEDFCMSYESNWFDGCTLTIVDIEGRPQFGGPGCPDWIIRPTENIGYGRACNAGAQCGTNDVILLANADTLLTNGFEDCYQALINRPDWGVLGPRQVDADYHITAGGIFGDDRSPAQRGWNELDSGQYSDVRDDALSVSGALYFIKRTVWNELTKCLLFQQAQPESRGAFLETHLYFEETMCSYHARAHGYKCVYYGPVQMVHYWHKSIAAPSGFGEEQFIISQQMHRQACQIHGILSE